MSAKIAGACSLCDKEVFDVIQHDPLPRRIGKPHDDAMRVTFVLFSGPMASVTFCERCAGLLEPVHFPALWNRIMESWVAESGADHPGGAKAHVDDGIAGILHVQRWKEVLA